MRVLSKSESLGSTKQSPSTLDVPSFVGRGILSVCSTPHVQCFTERINNCAQEAKSFPANAC
jgi:hypothetical protein